MVAVPKPRSHRTVPFRAPDIVALHFHDLRGTAITMLPESGSNPQAIAAVTGHSLRRIAEILDKYLARIRALADDAIDRFENSPRTKFANRLQTTVPKRTKKIGKAHAK